MISPEIYYALSLLNDDLYKSARFSNSDNHSARATLIGQHLRLIHSVQNA